MKQLNEINELIKFFSNYISCNTNDIVIHSLNYENISYIIKLRLNDEYYMITCDENNDKKIIPCESCIYNLSSENTTIIENCMYDPYNKN